MQTEKAVCQNTENVELIMISSFCGSQNENKYITSKLGFKTAPCYLHELSQLSD